jgi:hypothetical protein
MIKYILKVLNRILENVSAFLVTVILFFPLVILYFFLVDVYKIGDKIIAWHEDLFDWKILKEKQ